MGSPWGWASGAKSQKRPPGCPDGLAVSSTCGDLRRRIRQPSGPEGEMAVPISPVATKVAERLRAATGPGDRARARGAGHVGLAVALPLDREHRRTFRESWAGTRPGSVPPRPPGVNAFPHAPDGPRRRSPTTPRVACPAMAEADELVPLPDAGRVFRDPTGAPRRCRRDGRLRFDALARYLQDVSNDDTRDAGFADAMGWVVRRTVVEVRSARGPGEAVTLRDVLRRHGAAVGRAPGVGGGRRGRRRRGGDAVGAPRLATMTARRVCPEFMALFAEAAGGRTVRARLLHPTAPAAGRGAAVAVAGHRLRRAAATSTTPSTGRRSRRCWPGGPTCAPGRCGPGSSSAVPIEPGRRRRRWSCRSGPEPTWLVAA